ncbi:heat shock protein 82-like [Hibiscus syriacus]|uniref:heat shock protein 82-like n=1 Tax=Hibiscus syriacus TaxID=106335 RepID=UPI0019241893|nr:heat shock protein 82-like [Hibiscus syriacus]
MILSIIDGGIGMSKADLVNNLGSIAWSRTKELWRLQLINSVSVSTPLILVAEKVIETTMHNADEQTSRNPQVGSFTVTRDVNGDQFGRLEERRIRDLVKKHYECISYLIYLWIETTEKEISDDEDGELEKEEGDVEDLTRRLNLGRRSRKCDMNALLASEFSLDDLNRFTAMIQRTLKLGLSIDKDENSGGLR